MKKITIYHNSQCSKSRAVLKILQEKNLELNIIEYLKNPLNQEQLKELRAHFALKDFVRTHELIFKELKLSLDNEEEILQVMQREPILMERPIIVIKNQAIIGRPPEKVLKFLEEILA